MDELHVDYAALRNGLRELSGLFLRLTDEVENIASYTENLDIFWDGDANTAFMAGLSDCLVDVTASLIRLRKTVKAADGAFSVYMTIEEKVQKIIMEYQKKITG